MCGSESSRHRGRGRLRRRPALLAVAVAVLFFGCRPFELREILDGPQGKALSISPSAAAVGASNTATFSATGGVGPYVFSLASGGGSINASTGLYTAPVAAGSAVVRVTDKTGKIADAAVTIQAFSSPLTISPAATSVSIAGSMTFVALGGTSPYTFSMQTSGSGSPAVNNSGQYVAGLVPGADVIKLTDNVGATVTATVTVTPLSAVDYSVPTTTFSASGTVSTAIPGGQSFTLKNSGTGAGAAPVDWKVYLSANTVLDGGDSLIASGTVAALAAGASIPVTVTGTFPAVTPGSYYLIVQVSAADDTTPLNNISAASALTLNPQNIDYTVPAITNTGGTAAGGPMSGTFTIKNSGTAAGADVVFWQVRASADTVLDASDYLLAGGSIPSLGAGATSAPINFNGTWPTSPGSWYLIAVVVAADDVNLTNNATPSAAPVITTGVAPLNVDYTVVSVVSTGGTTTGKPLAGTFTYKNGGSDAGTQPVYWTAYVSSDATLQVGTDPVVDSGSVGAMGPGATSGPIAFTGTWPSSPGTWYLIVAVSASDDLVPTNNVTASGSVSITVPNVDYTVTTVNNTGGTVAGDPLSGTFTYRNGGTQDGSQAVAWTAYLSSDSTLQIGTDVVIDSGLVGALAAGATSANIPFNGTWASGAGSWHLIIALTVAEDVNNANNATASGAFATTAPNVDYIVTSVTNTGATTAGGPLSGNLIIKNNGLHAGTQFVPWRVFVSANTTLEVGTDVLIASGSLPSPGLAAGASSASIPFAGTWPSSPTTQNWYIIVEVAAGDDVTPANNVGATASTIAVTGVSPQYSITAVPAPTGPPWWVSQGVSGTFTVQNVGNGPGTAPVSWQVYASLGNGTYDAGDTLLASGSFGGLSASGSSSPAYVGTWPATSGSYQIIVRISAADAPAVPDAASASVAVGNPPPPDYTATFSPALPWSGTIGASMNATGTTQFTIQNVTANPGHSNISWTVYLSTDTVLDAGDTLVQTGMILPLAGSASTPITFSGFWPSPGNFYYLIVVLQAADDSIITNNVVVAPHPVGVGNYRYQEGAENNGAKGPTPNPAQTSDTLVTTLGANQSLVIEGTMDAYIGVNSQYDTYKFTTVAGLNNLSMRAMWATGFDDIDLYLWDTGTTNLSSISVGIDSEPGAGTFDVTSVTPRICYISANSWLANNTSGSAGQKYVILVKGLP
jgi:hypothetical protein